MRLVEEIRTASSPEVIQTIAQNAALPVAESRTEEAARTAQQRALQLKALIIKTANEVYSYADEILTILRSEYVAQSDFGEYVQSIERTIQETARETIDSYQLVEQISALAEDMEGLESYLTVLDGQIRRGILTDPDTGLYEMGIAISQNLEFTGQTVEEGGATYYELAEGQTLGLYTSTGWKFYINGHKAGWFDSSDGKLHVANIIAESSIQLGADWLVTTSGGFGIRYTGGE